MHNPGDLVLNRASIERSRHLLLRVEISHIKTALFSRIECRKSANPVFAQQHLWEGPCLVRTAPHGLELFSPTVNPDEPNKPVMTIDYYSVEVSVLYISSSKS